MLLHLLLIAESLLSFSFDLQKELQPKNQNAIYSPLSIGVTLGVVGAGAKEETLTQINRTLHFKGTQEALSNSFRELLTDLLAPKQSYPKLVLNLETVLWLENNFQFLPQFQSEVVKDFFGELRPINFEKPEEAVKEINHWFFLKSGGQFGTLFTNKDITKATKLIAVSTLYFKGYFEKSFDPAHTRMLPFHLTPQNEISTLTMHQKNQFPYYKGDGFEVVELNYLPLDKQLALWIVLPEKDLQLLDIEQFKSISTQLKPQSLELELPRFRISSSLNLIPTLQNLGMTQAFTPQANFSFISEANELMISDFKHRALIIVVEAGTLAEAATSASFVMKSLPPQEAIPFHVNRPFLFFLVDKKNNIPLFMGQVFEPKGSVMAQF